MSGPEGEDMTDARALAEEAKESGNGESYRILERTPVYRIAAGARGRSRLAFFVEVILDPFPHRPRVESSDLEEAAARARSLAARGYALTYQDDGSVSCEKSVESRELSREIVSVRALVGGGSGDSR